MANYRANAKKNTIGVQGRIHLEHNWRTREDPFEQEWEEIKEKLEANPGLEAKTIFEALKREKPGEFTQQKKYIFLRNIFQGNYVHQISLTCLNCILL